MATTRYLRPGWRLMAPALLLLLACGLTASSTEAGPSPGNVAADIASGDESWDPRFNTRGINGTVYSVVLNGSDVYVGGSFTEAGTVPANNIAKWDGSQWSALGRGVDGPVYEIELDKNALYVGGAFTTADGVAVNNIARWDGDGWSALGGGVTGQQNSTEVRAIEIGGGNVYVGGRFTTAGDVSAASIASWNGSQWSALGSGVGVYGYLYALSFRSGDLFAGGAFTEAGGTSANNIAKWDGSQWSALGSGVGVNRRVYALAFDANGTDLYVGGYFQMAGGVSANNIAKWDGSQWSALGSGADSSVYTLAISGTDVLAGVIFTSTVTISTNGVARWDGSQWSALGSGVSGVSGLSDPAIRAIEVDGQGNVYVGGTFTFAGDNVNATGIARWENSQWAALGAEQALGMAGNVHAIAITGTEVYAGGDFIMAGDVRANNIARWDGSAWHALGSGVNGHVSGIAVIGNDIYVGGRFTMAGGVAANRIARWDGIKWSPLGSGVDGGVYDIVVSGGDLYAGGRFTTAGDQRVNFVARWDGRQWYSLGGGVTAGDYDGVSDLAVGSNGEVYVGGDFRRAGGVEANNVARWDGREWSALGTGASNDVFAITVAANGDVYVGGIFTTVGGTDNRFIARWNGSNWSGLGSGTSNSVFSLATDENGGLYVGGGFAQAGGRLAHNVAYWNGEFWSSLGSGTNGTGGVYSLSVVGREVYMGGSFSRAGMKPSRFFALWQAPPQYTCAVTFVDVPEGSTFYSFVSCLACRDIIGGYSDGTFRPDTHVTRGQLSKVVANSAGFNQVVSGQTFEDVPSTDSFYEYIERMAERGIIGGYACGGAGEPCGTSNRPYFRPNANATRGQISKIVSQARGYTEPVSGQTFEDVSPSNDFYLYIERLASRGIMGGYPCGTVPGEPCGTQNQPYFRWGSNATRGQTSKIVANTFFPGCRTEDKP